MLWQHLFNGLVQGAIYSLGALGFALIYGVMRLVQFAHGEVIMIGSYFGFMAIGMVSGVSVGLAGILAVGAGMAAGAGLGFVIERSAFRTLRGAPEVASAMATIGLGFILRDAARLIWGAEMQRYIEQNLTATRFSIGGARISGLQLIIVGVSVLLMIGLQLLLHRTRIGMAIRAIAQNPLAAEYVGIDCAKVVPLTFSLGSGVAGIAGVMIGLYYNVVWPTFGFVAGLRAFAATVLGGLTSVGGAVVGGIILGLSENLGSAYIGSAWRDVVAFAILFLMLVVRPRGLLGE
jgi:branched-chain amino acid transport system permease protein